MDSQSIIDNTTFLLRISKLNTQLLENGTIDPQILNSSRISLKGIYLLNDVTYLYHGELQRGEFFLHVTDNTMKFLQVYQKFKKHDDTMVYHIKNINNDKTIFCTIGKYTLTVTNKTYKNIINDIYMQKLFYRLLKKL